MTDHAFALARLCAPGSIRIQVVNGSLWVENAAPGPKGYWPQEYGPGGWPLIGIAFNPCSAPTMPPMLLLHRYLHRTMLEQPAAHGGWPCRTEQLKSYFNSFHPAHMFPVHRHSCPGQAG